MATFNQQGQVVQTQYNAETINFGDVTTKEDFLRALQQMQTEIQKAADSNLLDEDAAVDATAALEKAAKKTAIDTVDATSVIEHITTAGKFVKGVDGLVTGCGNLATTFQGLF